MYRYVGIICICLSVMLYVRPFWQHAELKEAQSTLIETYVEAAEQNDMEWNKSEVQQVVTGFIEMPTIDLQMPLFNEATEQHLLQGAAIVDSSRIFGIDHVAIAGHRGAITGKYFNRLDELNVGDEIIVHYEGKQWHFIVTKQFVVHESQTDILNNTDDPLLTLITCTPVGQKNPDTRLIVQANLKK